MIELNMLVLITSNHVRSIKKDFLVRWPFSWPGQI